jgi:addiction module HigA family antidote
MAHAVIYKEEAMRKENELGFQPDYAVPPGETLQETIEALGMTQAELAARTGLTPKTINFIVKGNGPITPDTALQLERVLGTPASFWNNLERQYREALAWRGEHEDLASQEKWLERFPYRAMVKAGWVHDCKDVVSKIRALLNFFGVANPQQWAAIWEKPEVAFRASAAFKKEPGAVAAWLRKGELDAQKIETASYDESRFRRTLENVRALTNEPPEVFEPALKKSCAEAGVAWVLVPELPGTHTHGATRWLTPTKALIQLSLRYKSNDQIWFSFFHEAGHILLHGKKDVFLEENGGKGDKEDEANRFAADRLIPPADYRRFLASSACTTHKGVKDFADQIGIAPGIVVGRLQHEKKLPQSHLNDLKVRFEWKTPN